MTDSEKPVRAGQPPSIKTLHAYCRLLKQYQLESLRVNPDGSISIQNGKSKDSPPINSPSPVKEKPLDLPPITVSKAIEKDPNYQLFRAGLSRRG